ncbi:MAG TPA: hypothetical protein VH249_19915 [Xanthobacteraceae bacterium]|nr:hypothetical protein [Xanthobacteraceae bacterium]
MTFTDTRAAPAVERTTLGLVGLQWTPIIAGAMAAAALAFVLHSFALAVGLSLSSTAPTWRDASFALVFLSGLYIILAALASYGFGAYVAARLRARLGPATPEDLEFGDGMHGLIVWALATLLAAVLALAALQALPRLAAPTGASAGAATSVGSENLIAYDLDRLFRGTRAPATDMSYIRAEAGRILLTTASHAGMSADDRTYLIRLTAAATGLAPADAERRVTEVAANAKADIDRARRSAVLLGFMTGAAALLGAAAAWFAAAAGGRHREGVVTPPPMLDWGRQHRYTWTP